MKKSGMKLKADSRVALVTGSDRGIGFEVCRQFGERGYRVLLTGPNRERGEAAAAKLRRAGADVVYHYLDVVDERSVQALRTFVLKKFGRVDVLVNNAGVLLDERRSELEGVLAKRLKRRPKKVDFGEGPGVLEVDIEIVRATLEVNTLGKQGTKVRFIERARQSFSNRSPGNSSEAFTACSRAKRQ